VAGGGPTSRCRLRRCSLLCGLRGNALFIAPGQQSASRASRAAAAPPFRSFLVPRCAPALHAAAGPQAPCPLPRLRLSAAPRHIPYHVGHGTCSAGACPRISAFVVVVTTRSGCTRVNTCYCICCAYKPPHFHFALYYDTLINIRRRRFKRMAVVFLRSVHLCPRF
jgi:hypothetical protein